MVDMFEKTGLWVSSLGANNLDNEDREKLERLRTAFGLFRERAAQLTSQIHKALPALTVHDVTHLDALWETADLIAGPAYPLNPMEGFVLGGAILLHDAALCFEAYERGQEGLRECVEWKDAYAAAHDRSPHESEANLRSTADFATLRNLHAKQACQLGTKGWKTDGKEIHLIDDFELRKCYGETIGLISESHNWPLEKVSSKLRNQLRA